MPPWNAAKAKVQLRLSVQRLRTLQQKKEAQAKATRRDIAMLLERGKIETARIKVESLINEDIHVELLELLELYCELLLARFGLLDQNTREPDQGVSEGICSIIHAAPRTELKELHVLRDILMHRYGRDFAIGVMENKDGCVSDRVMRKLTNAMPSRELVDAYMAEIAKAYGVAWSATVSPADSNLDNDNNGPEGGVKESASSSGKPAIGAAIPDLSRESVSESAPKLPDLPPTEDDGKMASDHTKTSGSGSATNGKMTPRQVDEDDFESLARRFAALKNR